MSLLSSSTLSISTATSTITASTFLTAATTQIALSASAGSGDNNTEESSSDTSQAAYNDQNNSATSIMQLTSSLTQAMTPRVKSLIYMSLAMAIHFGGYEFFRNSCLSIFTSSEYGFKSPAAFPFAQGLIGPFSVLLLWGYGHQLENNGPRTALFRSTLFSVIFISFVSTSLALCRKWALPSFVGQALIGLTFLFQNSYQYLLYTQHWSFVGSVMTPDEGSRWFASLAGLSSLVCTITGGMVPKLLPYTGLLGLMSLTALTLSVTLFCSDRAYFLAEENGFDPADQMQEKYAEKTKNGAVNGQNEERNRFKKAVDLFRREPTLAGLLCEVLSFQCLNIIFNVAFVRSLKTSIPDDLARSAYTGRLFSLINGASAFLQFTVLPVVMKYTEPKYIWQFMPLIPLGLCLVQVFQNQASLALLASNFFISKVLDYSLRTVVVEMVYQPLA